MMFPTSKVRNWALPSSSAAASIRCFHQLLGRQQIRFPSLLKQCQELPFQLSTRNGSIQSISAFSSRNISTKAGVVSKPITTSLSFFASGVRSWGLPCIGSSIVNTNILNLQQSRSIHKPSKKKHGKKKLNAEQRKKQARSTRHDIVRPEKKPDEISEEHLEWVKFQKDILVEGFETGQTVVPISSLSRSAKFVKHRKELTYAAQARIAERIRVTKTGGGHYPPARRSDEETERMLKEAYEALPVRTGRRGTNQARRQKRRWRLVREIHAKYKYHMLNYQSRKMAKRSWKIKTVLEAIKQVPVLRDKDLSYQAQSYKRWVEKMVLDQQEDKPQTQITQ